MKSYLILIFMLITSIVTRAQQLVQNGEVRVSPYIGVTVNDYYGNPCAVIDIYAADINDMEFESSLIVKKERLTGKWRLFVYVPQSNYEKEIIVVKEGCMPYHFKINPGMLIPKKTYSVELTRDIAMVSEKELAAESAYWKGLAQYNNKNYADAVKNYTKAAKNGHKKAQCALGQCYENGTGVSTNMKTAAKWYKTAADQGDANALYYLGRCNENGLGIKRDRYEAFRLYKKSAEQGNVDAFASLGKCYYYGNGVKRDYEKAADWLSEAFEQGHTEVKKELADAQYEVGYMYYNGDGVSKDYAKAVECFREAAQSGHSKAQFWLGHCYLRGLGTTDNDSMAVTLYKKAANQGDPYGQIWLGQCYFYGWGVQKNYEAAVEWYTKGASNYSGYQYLALRQIATCYENGYGVKQNYTEAIKWYTKLAQNDTERDGNDAYNKLAYMAALGKGMEQSYIKAHEFIDKAINREPTYWNYYDSKGEIYLMEGNTTKAREYYNKCMELNSDYSTHKSELWKYFNKPPLSAAELNNQLGDEYYDKFEIKKAVSYYIKAANEGNIDAQFSVYMSYHWSEIYNSDSIRYWRNKIPATQIFSKYKEEAKAGNARAQYRLAQCYSFQIGTNSDNHQHVYWMKQSAENGYTPAYNDLAYCAAKGTGMYKSFTKAHEYIDKAIAIDPKNWNYYDTKGELYLMEDKRSEARIQYNKCLSLYSDYRNSNSNLWKYFNK